ncbi:hypothetical protein DHX103_03730 [Planococcus sp. X10-3]|uniref:hypothetical protein n=1 Tax=Planococcus sp. X10-3 TaxID=3061240 RepID=UPI003BB16F32
MKIIVIILILGLSLSIFLLMYKARKIYPQLVDGSLKEEKKKNVDFSNALYVCKNTECNRKFFRLYQVLEQWKYGIGSVHDFKNISLQAELQIIATQSVESFTTTSKMVCPTCLNRDVERTKEYEWMTDAPDFPRLSNTGLKELRNEFNRRKQSGLSRLKEIEKIIEEKESLEAFQWQYKLDNSFYSGKSEFDNKRNTAEDGIIKMKQEIIAQLDLLQESTPFLNEKARIVGLIKRVNQTAAERYKKQSLGAGTL